MKSLRMFSREEARRDFPERRGGHIRVNRAKLFIALFEATEIAALKAIVKANDPKALFSVIGNQGSRREGFWNHELTLQKN